jgi:hypothetical protein
MCGLLALVFAVMIVVFDSFKLLSLVFELSDEESSCFVDFELSWFDDEEFNLDPEDADLLAARWFHVVLEADEGGVTWTFRLLELVLSRFVELFSSLV